MPSLTYVERKPPSPLAAFIECFWVVRDRRRRQQRAPNRILPDGCPEWIIHAGDPFERCVDQRWLPQPRSFLAGTLTRPWLIRSGASVRTVGIRFKPGAAAVLLDLSLVGTADREIDLVRELQEPARRLIRSVCGARTTVRMLDVAQDELLHLVAPRLHRVPKTRAAIERLVTTRGKVRIDTLATSLGVSRRTLERRFDAELGISPKQYARIVRFNAVLSESAERERTQLVDLALAAGYFDEAHLLRDVRSLAGRKLRRDARDDGELARHFTRPERLRMLLERALSDPE
jgi:AraC-like DNA-binding protein